MHWEMTTRIAIEPFIKKYWERADRTQQQQLIGQLNRLKHTFQYLFELLHTYSLTSTLASDLIIDLYRNTIH